LLYAEGPQSQDIYFEKTYYIGDLAELEAAPERKAEATTEALK
jgi:hypothetical protein